MASETDKRLTDAALDAGLRALAAPPMAADFADRVMDRIGQSPRCAWRRWPRRWAVAAMVMVGAGAALVAVMVRPAVPAGARLVRFVLRRPGATQVALAGSFNDWGRRVALRARGHGLWSVRLPLKAGRYTYVFVVNGHEVIPDPHAEAYRPDGFGGENSVIVVNGPREVA